jgi:putative Mg2+ transporter-C (MgtC) family protein
VFPAKGDVKMSDMFSTEIVIRLSAAALLGGLLGLEREMHGRPAGLRTHLLVSLGAAAFMILSPFVAVMDKDLLGDPGRIAAQIVTGIGFLGAGAIIKEGLTIRGLTTAACLWIAAAIGMTTGAGCYVAAALVSALAICALVFLPYVERLLSKHSYRVLEITSALEVDAGAIVAAVEAQNVRVLRCDMDRDYDRGTLTTALVIRLFHRDVTDKRANTVVKAIEGLEISPKRITWRA